jgi:hypothetical protein
MEVVSMKRKLAAWPLMRRQGAIVQIFIAEQWVNGLFVDFQVWTQRGAKFLLTLCCGIEALVPLVGQMF